MAWLVGFFALLAWACNWWFWEQIKALRVAHGNTLMIIAATEKGLITRIDTMPGRYEATDAARAVVKDLAARVEALESVTVREKPEPVRQFRTGTEFRKFAEADIA